MKLVGCAKFKAARWTELTDQVIQAVLGKSLLCSLDDKKLGNLKLLKDLSELFLSVPRTKCLLLVLLLKKKTNSK